jgi:hypothetical protein
MPSSYLAFGLFFVLHLLLALLDGGHGLALLEPFLVRGQTGVETEWFLVLMPVLAWTSR